jgi:hypothetical protein
LDELRKVIVSVAKQLLADHVKDEHGFIGYKDIEDNLVRKDYSNLQTPWINGKYSLVVSSESGDQIGWSWRRTKSSNGIMEYNVKYGFQMKANDQSADF